MSRQRNRVWGREQLGMSFRCAVADILATSKLAWDIYSVYKDTPDDFRNISDEIKSLHSILVQ